MGPPTTPCAADLARAASELLDDLQDPAECAAAFGAALERLGRVGVYAELGLGRMGLYRFAFRALRPRVMIGVDHRRHEPFRAAYDLGWAALISESAALDEAARPEIVLLEEDSHGLGALAWLRAHAPAIDLLVVDADHSYAAVRADVALWRPYVRPGGLVLLHDTAFAPGVARLARQIRLRSAAVRELRLQAVDEIGARLGFGIFAADEESGGSPTAARTRTSSSGSTEQ